MHLKKMSFCTTPRSTQALQRSSHDVSRIKAWTPSANAESLREEIRTLESQLEDESNDADELRDNAKDACRWIRRALDTDDRELSVEQLLQKALDCLE